MSKTTLLGRSRVLFLLVPLALAAACTTKPLVTPRPLAATGSPEQTRVAILRALVGNNWVLESERMGEIVARYGGSSWNMVVEIAYSNEISIRYVSSENLDFETEDGTPVIHSGYNARVLRLSKEIEKEIMIARLTDSLPPVAAPPAAGPQPH
jgi:hypothetical protein